MKVLFNKNITNYVINRCRLRFQQLKIGGEKEIKKRGVEKGMNV